MAPLGLELIPANNVLWYYNTANFNDPNSPSYWYWKTELVIAGRVATINRVVLCYRDLGIATPEFIVNYSVSSDSNNPNTVQTLTTPITIGTAAATKAIFTLILGINVTGTNFAVGIFRAANAGPVSITNLRIQGAIEKEF